MASSFNEKKAEYQESVNDITSEREFEYANEGIIDINREHAGSSKLAYFNVVCVVAGTGTLGLPMVIF